jgi:outer membrane protein assembly factor BamB
MTARAVHGVESAGGPAGTRSAYAGLFDAMNTLWNRLRIQFVARLLTSCLRTRRDQLCATTPAILENRKIRAEQPKMRRIIEAICECRQNVPTMLAVGALSIGLARGTAFGEHRLIDHDDAAHLGLTRAWFTQVRLNAGYTHVVRAKLEGDRLTVLTSAGVVQELDARTGKTHWIAPIGNPNYPSLGPAGNDKFVAVVNGSTLYVLDRKDGKPAIVRSVGGAPGAGPALSTSYVFIPLVRGRIEAYPLNDPKLQPWFYQSYGRAMVAPLVTPESIVWTTDAGYLYVGGSDKLGMRYRLETGAEIVATPSYHQPLVFVGSLAGDLFAMHELTGAQQWKYSTGFPIMRSAAAVDDKVFVTSGEPMLHCIHAKTGAGIWEAPHIKQFASASKTRVYAVNDLGAFVVLDASTGATLAQETTDRSIHALVNDQTDRVYLVSDEGLVECFHEIGLKEPIYHNPKPATPKEAGKPAGAAMPPAKPVTAPVKPKATEPAEKPSAGSEKAPANEGAATEENPFG